MIHAPPPLRTGAGAGARARARALAGPLALLLAGVASLATSTSRQVRQYPGWYPEDQTRHQAGCAAAFFWVSKSGKQGLGVTARLEAQQAACAVSLEGSVLLVAGRTVTPLDPPAPVEVEPGRPAHVYLAFPFDGDAVWNGYRRHAVLQLTLVASGARTALSMPFHQVLEESPTALGRGP